MGFPERLDLAIVRSNKSQGRLAKETGIAQNSISMMTRGAQRPYLDQAIALARATGVRLSWLADVEDEPADASRLSDDERFIIQLYRDLNLGRAESVRRMCPEASPKPGPMKVIGDRDLSHLSGDEEGKDNGSKDGGKGGQNGGQDGGKAGGPSP